jgi:hypothetical protein
MRPAKVPIIKTMLHRHRHIGGAIVPSAFLSTLLMNSRVPGSRLPQPRKETGGHEAARNIQTVCSVRDDVAAITRLA